MNVFFIVASILLVWDDPDNDPRDVAGYNVYRVEFDGTGKMIRHKVNPELIPWVADGPETPSLWIRGVLPLEEYRGTAVGVTGQESPISDDFYRVPMPPAAVPTFRAVGGAVPTPPAHANLP